MKLNVGNYKNSDSLILDIKKFFNKGEDVGIVKWNPQTNREHFVCEFNQDNKLDKYLLDEKNYKKLKIFIIDTCKFNSEKTITVRVELEGFEDINTQLDILLDKCNKINKTDINSIKNNIIDEIARELALKNTMIK